MTPKRLDSVRDDLRHFFRICRRSPGFAVLAIGTLSLGIGAAVAIFSGLPARRAGRVAPAVAMLVD